MIRTKSVKEFNRLSKDSKNFSKYVATEVAQQLTGPDFKRQRERIIDAAEFLCDYYFGILCLEDSIDEILKIRFTSHNTRRGAYIFICEKIIECFKEWIKMYDLPRRVKLNDDYTNVYEEFYIKDMYLSLGAISNGARPNVQEGYATMTGLMMEEGSLFSSAMLSHNSGQKLMEVINNWKEKTKALADANSLPIKMVGSTEPSWNSEELVIL